ncbi:hypothetical protein ACODM8_14430 [Vibrio ostreicida]|uniref:hypothetical protein n=1 Tax=Vibrio ostreicida TaxID=526588 RepID=UPI003B5AFC10
MTVLQQLDKRMIDFGLVVLVGVSVWFTAQSLAKHLDKTTKTMTQPAGELISDLVAMYNGWSAVEIQPLMIRDFYLTPDYKLTPSADQTLWGIEQYRPLMVAMFGFPGGTMAEKYRSLINQPIE